MAEHKRDPVWHSGPATIGLIFLWLLVSPRLLQLMASLARSLDPEDARVSADSPYVWLGAFIVVAPVALLVVRWRRARRLPASPQEELLLKRPLTRQERLVNRGLAGFFFLLAAAAATIGYSISRRTTLKVAESTVYWSRVSGVVTESRSEDGPSTSGGTGYEWIFHYKYRVNGTEYTGFRRRPPLVDIPWIEQPPSFNGSSAGVSAAMTAYREGKAVDVWYDPADPSRSVLIPGIPHGSVALTASVLVSIYGFGAIMIALGLVFLRMRERSAGSAKARREWLAQHDLTEESAARPPGKMRIR